MAVDPEDEIDFEDELALLENVEAEMKEEDDFQECTGDNYFTFISGFSPRSHFIAFALISASFES